jgi:hypothetical protein
VALAVVDPIFFKRPDIFAAEFAKMRMRLKESSFFVPLAYRKVVEEQGLLPLDRCFFSHMSGSMARHRNFSVDLTGSVPAVQTVSLFAIMLSLYMGCNPIYLIGMDHDFLADPKHQTHFSDAYESTLSESEKAEVGIDQWSYLRLIQAVEIMFGGYKNLKGVADRRHQEIYNASEGSYLDVFPFVSFADIISPEGSPAKLLRRPE